jgi:hypothetical protein
MLGEFWTVIGYFLPKRPVTLLFGRGVVFSLRRMECVDERKN